jgi:outer membrane protein
MNPRSTRTALTLGPLSPCWALWLAAGAAVWLGGCSSPIGPRGEEDLRRSVRDAARREMEHARTAPLPRVTTRESTTSQLEIAPRFMEELEAMAGPRAYDPTKFDVGPDLLGQPQRTATVSLERAIRTAVVHNLEAQFARLAPVIAEAQVVAAESAFDWTFFSNTNYSSIDEPRTVTRQGFSTFGSGSEQTESTVNTTGLRRQLVSGGAIAIQQELTVTDFNTPGQTISPDPASSVEITAQLDQPLLRGFGSDVTLSQVRLDRNAERDSIAALQRTLIATVTDTERAYWQLYQAHRALLIRQRHLDEGIKTRDHIHDRWKQVGDANEAQHADSVSRVESRKTELNTARNNFLAASDRLRTVMNDPDLTVGSDILLIPADVALDVPIEYSLIDLVGTALARRPEVQQAILSIDNTSIRLDVANNARLPKLDLRLQAKWNGLDDDFNSAYDELHDRTFVDGLVGLNFEMPIGNRGAEAIYVRRNQERMQAIMAYRNTAQQITGQIFSSLRNLLTSYAQIEQTRNSRLAAANSYRAFRIEKEIKLGNTVDSLNLEFQRQDALAQAELQEVAAITNYNVSIAELYAASGTTLERNRIEFKVPDIGTTPPARTRRPERTGKDAPMPSLIAE